MNAAQIHLALNHVPLFLSVIGSGILVLGMIRKNESFINLSLYLMVAAALFTAPVYLTGEGTEELVEHLPGVNEQTIGKHEEMANISLVIIIITGVVALAGLFLRKNTVISKMIIGGAILLSLASFGTMAQTAHLGGLIRHSELQAGAAAANDSKENEEEEEKGGSTSTVSPGLQKTTGTDSLTQANKKKKEDDD